MQGKGEVSVRPTTGGLKVPTYLITAAVVAVTGDGDRDGTGSCGIRRYGVCGRYRVRAMPPDMTMRVGRRGLKC